MTELKTCFKRVDYDLDGLLHFIDLGDIALPDIQRPFVWSVRALRLRPQHPNDPQTPERGFASADLADPPGLHDR